MVIDVIRSVGIGAGSDCAPHLRVERVDQHHAGLFLKRHPRHQIIDPFLDGQAPILVGVELAVTVCILELQTFNGQNALDPGADFRLFNAVKVIMAAASGSHDQAECDR